jgi:putative endonuclease
MTAQAPHLVQGRAAEDAALAHLKRQGLKLVTRNYRTPHGEIDLIMQEARVLVFVEVRFRRHQRFGSPAETVGYDKQRKLRASAEHYLQAGGDSNRPCRFDIVSVSGGSTAPTIDWLTNAF